MYNCFQEGLSVIKNESLCEPPHQKIILPCPYSIYIIDHGSTLWDSALKPLVSLHKRALKVILLKNTTLMVSDYKYLTILPLSQKLDYNKGVLMQKKMSDKPHLHLLLNFPQVNHATLAKSMFQFLGLTSSSPA